MHFPNILIIFSAALGRKMRSLGLWSEQVVAYGYAVVVVIIPFARFEFQQNKSLYHSWKSKKNMRLV